MTFVQRHAEPCRFRREHGIGVGQHKHRINAAQFQREGDQPLGQSFRNQLTDAGNLLQIWERQLSDARFIKQQYEIADNPKITVSMLLPDLAEYEEIEKRQQLLLQKLLAAARDSRLIKECFFIQLFLSNGFSVVIVAEGTFVDP